MKQNPIQQTNKYTLFKSFTSNREVDESHVKKLMDAISKKNMLPLNPIIVNDKMQVVDGQHRLEAAKRLKYDIFYIVSETIKKEDIASLNSNSKNWNLMDYINYYSVEKKPGFSVLSSFISQNPMIKPSLCLQLLSVDNSRNSNELKNGVIEVGNIKNAEEIVSYLKDIYNFCSFAYSRDFILAMRKIYDSGHYEHEQMMKQINKQPRSLVQCVNVKQYIEMLEDIYNRGMHSKISFKYK
ncbi:MAG: ParB N-terminal domain-containing protein [Bacteroidia bacterium]